MLFTLSVCIILATPIIGGLSLLAVFLELTQEKRVGCSFVEIVEEPCKKDLNKIAREFLANETRKPLHRSWTKAGYIVESGH